MKAQYGDINFDEMMADELPEEIRFDYSKAKSNRFAIQEAESRSAMVALDSDENEITCREELAFRRLHPSLLKTYKGQFVAIYQERLVDHDEDQIDLYLRVDEQYPDEFVMIAPVNEQAEEVYRFRSPHTLPSHLCR